jgi:hypothetical protein
MEPVDAAEVLEVSLELWARDAAAAAVGGGGGGGITSPLSGLAAELAGSGYGGGGSGGMGGSHGFKLWDVAFLATEQRSGTHRHEGASVLLPDVTCFHLATLSHRPDASHSDVTLLRWLPGRSLVYHAARLTLPHSSPLGIPTHLKSVPGATTGAWL